MDDRRSFPLEDSNPVFTILDRTCSKRALNLEEERNEINTELSRERKRLKPRASFDAEFWAQAANVENITLRRSEVQRKISLRNFIRDNESSAGWEQTKEAQDLFEQIRAQNVTAKICHDQAKRLSGIREKRSLRASFMKLFTTSKMGLDVSITGSGPRDSNEQSRFRADIINAYDSSYPASEPWLWCPILGTWIETGVAAHLFAYMHGQDTMDAIFGKNKKPELFSPRNGLLLAKQIEDVFDKGFLVIVPLLSDNPTRVELARWVMREPREYMTRIIDPSSKLMDKRVTLCSNLRFKDLDKRPLQFRNQFRPAARYLYFHYCLQILRQAWKQPIQESKLTLKNEVGRMYWGTPGRYIPQNMLLAFIEELGHEYGGLLGGASCSSGEDMALLAAASRQVKRRSPINFGTGSDGDIEDEDDEGEEDEWDEDGDEETVV